MHSFIRR